jgi:hypothetical protein
MANNNSYARIFDRFIGGPIMGEPHPAHVKWGIQLRLKTAFGKNPVVGPLLNQMKYGEAIAFHAPNPHFLKTERAVAYHAPSRIYVRSDCEATVALHELRHEDQFLRIGWRDWTARDSIPRSAYLRHLILEGDAEGLEVLGKVTFLEPHDTFNSSLYVAKAGNKRWLRHHFDLATHQLHDLKPEPDEVSFVANLADKCCVLTNGKNYLLGNKSARQKLDWAAEFIDIHIEQPWRDKQEKERAAEAQKQALTLGIKEFCDRLPNGYYYPPQAASPHYAGPYNVPLKRRLTP